MSKKNIIFNHTLEQYNKKYRNRRHRLLKYTKKQVEDFDKEYGHYIFNNKTYNLEHDQYLLKDKKWWFTKEDECYHEIPKPIRFAWFRNLNTGIQIATCALLAGGVIAGTTVGIIEYKKYDATLVVMGKSSKLPKGIGFTIGTGKTIERQDSTSPTPIVCISYEIKITTTESYVPTIEGGKPELVDVSVKKGDKELEKFVDFTFNSATGEVVIKKESMDKYYGKTVITPIIKTIKNGCTQDDWMTKYKIYSDRFQDLSDNTKRYEMKNIKVSGIFSDEVGNFHNINYSYEPLDWFISAGGVRTAQLIFEHPMQANKFYYQPLGGGEFVHSEIKQNIFDKYSEPTYKIDYIIGDDYLKYNIYNNDGLYRSATFNELGYITNTYGVGPTVSQFIIEYDGDPIVDEYYNLTSKGINSNGKEALYLLNLMKPFKIIKDKEFIIKFKTLTLDNQKIGFHYAINNNQTSFGGLFKKCEVYKNGEKINHTIYANKAFLLDEEIKENDVLIEIKFIPNNDAVLWLFGNGPLYK